MRLDIKASITAHRRAIDAVESIAPAILAVAQLLQRTFHAGGRVFACGNGGSAADVQHFISEFTGRYEKERRAYPAIALTTDTSALTAIANDYGYAQVFARQLEALARPGDVLFALSTSGNSANVVAAVEYARSQGITTVGVLGRDGGKLLSRVEHALVIPETGTARIQEAHILILHLLCEAFEE